MTEAASPLIYGCNLIVVKDGGKASAMVCSWATQVSDRYVLLCIGPQSETGKLLTVGRRFSLNVLLREQMALARFAGSKHSSEVDKLAGVPVVSDGDVITLQRAKKTMTCRVEKLLDVAPDGAVCGVLAWVETLPQEQAGEPLFLDEFLKASS